MIQSSVVSDSPPGRIQLGGACLVVVLAIVAASITIPYGKLLLPEAVGVMPAFGSLTGFADLFTAIVLVGQARATSGRANLHLAAAYLFSFLVLIPHLLSFPGVFAADALIGNAGTSTWLWCAWHAGFAVFVSAFAVAAPHDWTPFGREGPLLGLVILCAGGALALATLGAAHLPTVIVGNDYGLLNTLGVGPVVMACNLLALILVVTRLRARNTIALWLAVAMVAACLDVALGLTGGARFSLVWYMGRMLSLVSNVTVFIALLFESMRLFGRVSRVNRHLEHLSLTDPLTQLPNRRAFDTSLTMEWRRAEREMLPISLLMVDVDQFKGFNDSFGHPAGDRCLRLVAATLGAIVRRPLDLAARLGGEEFVLLLPNTEAAGAAWMGERVRAAIESLQIVNPGASEGIVTVSIGVATDHPRSHSGGPAGLIERADAALYEAKRAGRNHVHTMSPGAVAIYPPEAMAWCKADMVSQVAI